MNSIIFQILKAGKYTSKIAACISIARESNSYMNFVGWFQSFCRAMPIDRNGAAIPWYTYSAIDFLEGRINDKMSVYEYGSGNSTVWWANRVQNISSCEHDQQWFSKMKLVIPENVHYIHVDLLSGNDYEEAILKEDCKFDVVVIDGRKRVRCAMNCIKSLKDDGVIIWDNSDRKDYEEGYQFLAGIGWRRLDFSGLGPINTYGWCTSVFYRTSNCLGI